MPPPLNEKLDVLAIMPVGDLRLEWEKAYQELPPSLPRDALRLGIAYRWQEKAVGGLSRLVAGALRSSGNGQPAIISTKPGSRLVRSWNGRTISVQVSEEGFVFEDRTYRSLSAIAREVTGTAWSGPRFFGLTGAAKRG